MERRENAGDGMGVRGGECREIECEIWARLNLEDRKPTQVSYMYDKDANT